MSLVVKQLVTISKCFRNGDQEHVHMERCLTWSRRWSRGFSCNTNVVSLDLFSQSLGHFQIYNKFYEVMYRYFLMTCFISKIIYGFDYSYRRHVILLKFIYSLSLEASLTCCYNQCTTHYQGSSRNWLVVITFSCQSLKQILWFSFQGDTKQLQLHY